MNALTPPPIPQETIPTEEKVLRNLFMTLFLRGRGARGLIKRAVPKSVVQKLSLTLLFYFMVGCVALIFLRQPVFILAVYLNAMTFAFLGMFIAASAGEVLFNKEEADILTHRPVSPKSMRWAKIRVMVEISLWLGIAFNLVGLCVGFAASGWRFPIVHLFSTGLEALFCTGGVVLVYQLCLRWFGRERLDGLMTGAQVIVAVGAVLAGQVPRLLIQFDHVMKVDEHSWWIALLPPAWFAGLDDALAGSGTMISWLLAGLGITLTSLVLWFAFGKLASEYETGVQALHETVSTKLPKQGHRRLLDRIVEIPPLNWWLHHPVARSSFLLTSAYLIRDRDVKLRMYPGIVPILILPFIFLLQDHHRPASTSLGFGIPLAGTLLGMVPMTALQILQFSQQWQAADIFRSAPMAGPAQIFHGARRAIMVMIVLPLTLLTGLIVWLVSGTPLSLILFLPGIIAMPVFGLIPSLGGHGVPLSMPIEAAKATGRGLIMILIMMVSVALAGLASFSWSQGWFWWLLLGESIVAVGIYTVMRLSVDKSPWTSVE